MNNAWYAALHRPALTPPDWVFAPVWSVLYLTIAISIFLYYRTPEKPHMRWVTGLLAAHLFSNFIWTWLFFGLQSPGLAMMDILFLDLSLVTLILFFWKTRRTAALLLIPYLLWVLFATYLNAGFYKLN